MTPRRALLLTDVVDSTRLHERLGDSAMAELWAAHDRVARGLLPAWRGREIDKTDGMLLLFEHAADAVQYACAYHAALAGIAQTLPFALPWPLRARAGLHVGPVILRENPAEDVARGAKPLEVDGQAKPVVARVMSLACGEQTLLTPEAREAAEGLPPAVWHSHGHWRVKDVAAPLELFEWLAPGGAARSAASPSGNDKAQRVVRVGARWVPVSELPDNLPAPTTSFVGRERELGEIKALLADQPLVSLLGMGGLGKTRLSLQVAHELRAEFPDGSWFIDLSPLREAALVASEAAQVLGVHEDPPRPLLQVLAAALAPQRVLLVLDNCEHLLEAAAELVDTLVRAAPGVRVLASSREPLRVAGERAYAIHPLPLPGRGEGAQALLQSPAVRLFVDRARAHRPDFELTADEAPAVGELVQRLEGIPLALELAAARVRTMDVAEINQGLQDRYQLLTGGSRVLQARQKTLRALVDWSYDLLAEPEQRLLQRLAVFRGGFAGDAVAPVCSGPPVEDDAVPALLASLVAKSLVMREEQGEAPRYRMLETIGDYARERLEQAGGAAETAARHCEHFFALAKQTNKGLRGPEQASWIRRQETELDNSRAALALALAGGVDAFIAVKIAVAMQGFWTLRGYLSEGRSAVRAALALPAVQASPMAQAHALYVGAALAAHQSDHDEAERMLATCLALRRQLGNPAEIAATLSTLALARFGRGDVQGALAGEQEALALFQSSGHRVGEAIAQLHLGQFHARLENDNAARQHLEAGLTLAREIEHQEVEAECELVLGQTALAQEQREAAGRHFARSLVVCKASGNSHGEASAQWWQGKLALEGGELATARGLLCVALRAFVAADRRLEALLCLRDHARWLLQTGQTGVAVSVAATAAAGLQRIGAVTTDRARLRWQAELAALQAALKDADTFQRAWGSGHEAGLDAAVKTALAAAAAPRPTAG